jgi:hypothetical protein
MSKLRTTNNAAAVIVMIYIIVALKMTREISVVSKELSWYNFKQQIIIYEVLGSKESWLLQHSDILCDHNIQIHSHVQCTQRFERRNASKGIHFLI